MANERATSTIACWRATDTARRTCGRMTVKVVGGPTGQRRSSSRRGRSRTGSPRGRRWRGCRWPRRPDRRRRREEQPEEHRNDERELDQGRAGRTNTTAPRHSGTLDDAARTGSTQSVRHALGQERVREQCRERGGSYGPCLSRSGSGCRARIREGAREGDDRYGRRGAGLGAGGGGCLRWLR